MANFMDMVLTPEDRAEAERMKQAKELLAQQQATNPIDSSTAYVSLPQGMMPEAAPKPVATASDEDDSDEDDSSTVASKPAPKKSVLPKSTEGPTPPGLSPIEKLLSDNKSEMSDAQDSRNLNQLMAVLGKAGSHVGSALSRAPKAADTSGFDALFKAADQPVKDIEARQDSAMKALKGSSAEQTLKNEMAKEDPKSDISKIGRQILADAAKQAGSSIAVPETISLSNMKEILPGIENMANKRLVAMSLKANASAKQDNKETAAQDRALDQTQRLLNRNGDPEYQQALKDRYAGSKALALIKSDYNPDNLSPQQIHLLVSEVSKIATGGVPSVTEMEALTPNTLKGKLASVASKLTNHPTPATAGAFVRQYQNYLNDLSSNAQNVIDGKIKRVVEPRKKMLGDEYYQSVKDEYNQGSRFIPQEQNEMVNVISPEGQPGQIPKSNLDKAIKRGFKLVNG